MRGDVENRGELIKNSCSEGSKKKKEINKDDLRRRKKKSESENEVILVKEKRIRKS